MDFIIFICLFVIICLLMLLNYQIQKCIKLYQEYQIRKSKTSEVIKKLTKQSPPKQFDKKFP